MTSQVDEADNPLARVAPTSLSLEDPDPFRQGLMNLLVAGGLGYWTMGQRRKAIQTWLIVSIGGFFTCGTLWVFPFVTAYDAYLLTQRAALGERIRDDQNALPFLDRIFR